MMTCSNSTYFYFYAHTRKGLPRVPDSAVSLSKLRREGSFSSDSDLERLLSKIKRPRVTKRLFRPSIITVSDLESSDGATPDFGSRHKTAKDKVIKPLMVEK